jgi:hypothetical protein
MTERTLSDETRALVRKAVSDAYYDARNAGETMEAAADRAVTNLEPILASIDENAHLRGLHGDGALEDGKHHDGVVWGIRHPGPSRKKCPYCISTLSQGDGS